MNEPHVWPFINARISNWKSTEYHNWFLSDLKYDLHYIQRTVGFHGQQLLYYKQTLRKYYF